MERGALRAYNSPRLVIHSPLQPNATESISHPGEKSKVTTRKCDAFNCTNKVNPCKPKPLVTLAKGALRGAE